MSATASAPGFEVREPPPTPLVVAGIRNPRSAGISRYATLLAMALASEHVGYVLDHRLRTHGAAHFHLANSSRALLLPGSRRVEPFVVTVHDVVPRTGALLPLYRRLVYPQLAQRAGAVIVHTTVAADMLIREAGRRPRRLELIPHPAPRPEETDRATARRALGWPEDALIAVVPGVIKPVKLVREALAAVSRSPSWHIALAGKLVDRTATRSARAQGALVLANPGDRDYERAIVASDCVLCLRSGSVGETNGPLLDALGAGRAVLGTATGSIREVAGNAIRYCDGTESGIRASLALLADPDARAELESAATERAEALTWGASAALHASLFREVFGG